MGLEAFVDQMPGGRGGVQASAKAPPSPGGRGRGWDADTCQDPSLFKKMIIIVVSTISLPPMPVVCPRLTHNFCCQ